LRTLIEYKNEKRPVPEKKVNKTLNRLCYSFAVAVLGFTSLEATGYNLFDQNDGDNILCELDPHCRKLSPGETKLAREYFGDSIDYNSVNVFSRSIFYLPRPTIASSIFGNIYTDKKGVISSDYSTESIESTGDFLHEMGHVWQYERVKLKTYFKSISSDEPDIYEYKSTDHKRFLDFGTEQQAEIIKDIYSLRTTLKYNPSNRHEICQNLNELETLASQELPLKSFSPCTNS
jgi:hypothetical protein